MTTQSRQKKRVLFVDDEENVLHGLKVMLHTMRNEWNMSFAQGGEKALEMIAEAEEHFEVVVTDMHMPGMHGNVFLQKVMEASPESVRFVLSGNLNSDTLAKAGAVAHQIVGKPCDPHHLRALLTRAFALENRLPECPLKDTLFQMCGLPSVPLVYWDLQNEMNSPDPSIERVGQIIEKDPSMSAKVLQVANSASANSSRRISNITEAVAMLGVENIRSFILMAGIFETADQSQMPRGFSLEKLWEHGMRVGEFAKRITALETEDKRLVDDAYTAGLLHDIGLLILATKMPKPFAETLELTESGMSLLKAEKQVFGATHAEIGGFLLDLWGLPEAIVEAIAYHLYPSATPDKAYEIVDEDANPFTTITAVHVANYLCEDQDMMVQDMAKAEIDNVHLEEIGKSDRLEAWWDCCFATET